MPEVLFPSAIIEVVPRNKRSLRQYLMALFIILSQLHLKFKPTSLFECKLCCSRVLKKKKWEHHKFQVFSDMSIPVISFTSALLLSLSQLDHSVFLYECSQCVFPILDWITLQILLWWGRRSRLSWNLFTFQYRHLNVLRAKTDAVRPLQDSFLRSLGKTWSQFCMHKCTWRYSHSQYKDL